MVSCIEHRSSWIFKYIRRDEEKMTGTDIFKPFEITLPPGRRYWEDDATGVLVKQGQTKTIGQRDFRSVELRFALMRSQVLIKTGEVVFAFKDNIIKLTPGENKNLITIVSGPEAIKAPEVQNEIPKENVAKVSIKEETKKNKKVKVDMDDIPDMKFE
jgi:hypothetical protein